MILKMPTTAAKRHIKLIAAKGGDTTPSEPSEPSEPFEPSTQPTGPSGPSPFGALRHHLCPGGKRVTGFSVAQGLPTNPVPLPPRKRWDNKIVENPFTQPSALWPVNPHARRACQIYPLHLPFLFDKIKKLEYKYTCPWISYLCPLTGWLWKKKRAEVINRRFLLCQLYP